MNKSKHQLFLEKVSKEMQEEKAKRQKAK